MEIREGIEEDEGIKGKEAATKENKDKIYVYTQYMLIKLILITKVKHFSFLSHIN